MFANLFSLILKGSSIFLTAVIVQSANYFYMLYRFRRTMQIRPHVHGQPWKSYKAVNTSVQAEIVIESCGVQFSDGETVELLSLKGRRLLPQDFVYIDFSEVGDYVLLRMMYEENIEEVYLVDTAGKRYHFFPNRIKTSIFRFFHF